MSTFAAHKYLTSDFSCMNEFEKDSPGLVAVESYTPLNNDESCTLFDMLLFEAVLFQTLFFSGGKKMNN